LLVFNNLRKCPATREILASFDFLYLPQEQAKTPLGTGSLLESKKGRTQRIGTLLEKGDEPDDLRDCVLERADVTGDLTRMHEFA
jgi:hypothetical protein